MAIAVCVAPVLTSPPRKVRGGSGPVPGAVGRDSGQGRQSQKRSADFQQLHLERQEKGTESAALRRVQDSVLHLLDDGLLPDGAEIASFDAEGPRVWRNGVNLPMRELSDGYRTVLALVLDLASQIYRCFGELRLEKRKGRLVAPYPGVVLVDEIDAHLHVSWQQNIGFWLKEHFPEIQFIVTTHGPFICQAADPRGLIRLRAPGDERPTDHVPGELHYRIVNGSADDAVLTELFGLEHAHSDASEKIRDRVSKLEALVIQGKATGSQKRDLASLSAPRRCDF